MWKPTPPKEYRYKQQNFTRLTLAAKFIYQIGESDNLRKPSNKVSLGKITSPDYKAKFEYIKKCLEDYRKLTGKGRGIAAVQVGIPERFFAIYRNEAKNKIKFFINPTITKKSQELFRFPESCMSCNFLIAKVIRPSWVEFTYINEKGEEKIWDLKDTTIQARMYNRVVQHEIDHLNGIINIDTINPKELIFESNDKYYKKAIFEKV